MSGISFICSLANQNQDKKPNQGSLEDLSQDQPDQALNISEPINIQRRSPMIRNRKTGSMEVPDCRVRALQHADMMQFYPLKGDTLCVCVIFLSCIYCFDLLMFFLNIVRFSKTWGECMFKNAPCLKEIGAQTG